MNHKIFSIQPDEFDARCLETFRFQYENNLVYRRFVDGLKVDPLGVSHPMQVPFLPISTFKTSFVCTTAFEPEIIFESSGTTGANTSRHYVRELARYRESFRSTFRQFYGDPADWCIVGLLPNYLERGNSSLVVMVDDLIRESGHPLSGFYLYDHQALARLLSEQEQHGRKTMLIGVTFALLDFAEGFPMALKHAVVMETGGMKGRRKEMTRQEVHDYLKQRLGLPSVHAEYGMTELLSQAYSAGDGLYQPPPWMQVLVREEDDPLSVRGKSNMLSSPATGVINVIDLANLYSAAFIATDDLGKLWPDGRFEVLGRIDNSDIRGCSLMIELNTG